MDFIIRLFNWIHRQVKICPFQFKSRTSGIKLEVIIVDNATDGNGSFNLVMNENECLCSQCQNSNWLKLSTSTTVFEVWCPFSPKFRSVLGSFPSNHPVLTLNFKFAYQIARCETSPSEPEAEAELVPTKAKRAKFEVFGVSHPTESKMRLINSSSSSKNVDDFHYSDSDDEMNDEEDSVETLSKNPDSDESQENVSIGLDESNTSNGFQVIGADSVGLALGHRGSAEIVEIQNQSQSQSNQNHVETLNRLIANKKEEDGEMHTKIVYEILGERIDRLDRLKLLPKEMKDSLGQSLADCLNYDNFIELYIFADINDFSALQVLVRNFIQLKTYRALTSSKSYKNADNYPPIYKTIVHNLIN